MVDYVKICRGRGEPEDEVTNEYNLAMKRILPSHRIRLIEIPRKENGKKVISASRARKYLENGKYDELKTLIPETTWKVLFQD